MRQRTERRAAQLSGGIVQSSAPQTGSRQGTQEATITTVVIYESEGRSVETIRSGESITVELHISSTRLIDDLALTVGIFSDAHVKCFEATISSVRSTLGKITTHSSIRCHLKRLPLLPGCYYINVGLYPPDWSYVYDYHWQMHQLRVFDEWKSPVQSSGIIFVDTNWALTTHGDS
jgi:lipopolysaccharide transport system ATP-binding protein